jgi:hypothetical protein
MAASRVTILDTLRRSFPGFLLYAAIAHRAPGGPPPVPNGTPAVAASDYPSLSAAARLGIAFNPGKRAPMPESFPDALLMPRFIVSDTQARLTDRDMLTDKGALELAEKEYISPLYRATFGPLSQLAAYYISPLSILSGWHPNVNEARALYRQDERLRMLAGLDSLISLEELDDPRGSGEFREIRFQAAESSR